MVINEPEPPKEEVIEVNEKRSYHHSDDTNEEQVKETAILIPPERKDDWEEIKVSKLSNPNNKISDMRGYFVPKDTRRRRRPKDNLLNLSRPESIDSYDPVRTESTAQLVQPLVSYYDSFPGIKNYQTEISESEYETGKDIVLTERKTVQRVDTTDVHMYSYEKNPRPVRLRQQIMEGYVYYSENKGVEVEKLARSFDSEDYYFYKNEYYKKEPTKKNVRLHRESQTGYSYQKREKNEPLRTYRTMNYYYEGEAQEEVDWEVEKRQIKRDSKRKRITLTKVKRDFGKKNLVSSTRNFLITKASDRGRLNRRNPNQQLGE